MGTWTVAYLSVMSTGCLTIFVEVNVGVVHEESGGEGLMEGLG